MLQMLWQTLLKSSQNNIIFDTYEDNFKDNSGGINFTFAEDDNISVSFQLYNDRFNPFGENYKNGVEKYYIWYQREFNYIDNILNTENSAFKILPVILSNITSQNVTENETKQHFSELKETIQIPDCDYTKSEDNFIEESSNFKNVRIRYSLSYSNINNKLYEVISFGGEGYNNYTVVWEGQRTVRNHWKSLILSNFQR